MDRSDTGPDGSGHEPTELRKHPFQPIYAQTEVSQPIELGTTRVELDHDGKSYAGTAQVSMRFEPSPRVHFLLPAPGENPHFGFELMSSRQAHKVRLPERRASLDMLAVGSDNKLGGVLLIPAASPITVLRRRNKLKYATFHVFNFPNFLGAQDCHIVTESGSSPSVDLFERAVLYANRWVVIIAGTDRTRDAQDSLREKGGGFIITHVGRIERVGGQFSSKELQDVLDGLHWFLSFALGCWAGVGLPVGIDARANRVFEQWGMPMSTAGPWQRTHSWFDKHHGVVLSEVFPGFYEKLSDPVWGPTLKLVVSTYVRANRPDDTGIILAQIALENLAWTYCVRDRKMDSEAAFQRRGGLSAANKLRLLLSALQIPTKIPTTLRALHAKRGRKWADMPDMLTDFRNALVHPTEKVDFPANAHYEAWKVTLWLLDVVVLRLCGHRGSYANRLTRQWEGRVEPPP